jgi:hypothetical protein
MAEIRNSESGAGKTGVNRGWKWISLPVAARFPSCHLAGVYPFKVAYSPRASGGLILPARRA